MAIETIDNFNIFVGRNIDSRYGPYASVAEATGSINSIFRYKGLTVLITGSGQNIEYWFNPTTINSHLVPKGAAVSLSGTDTQVVFFSGSTQISGSPNITFDYTNNHFFVTGSTTLSGSTFIPGISNSIQTNVVTINPATGQLFYTASNSLTGVSIPLDIKDDGTLVYSNPAVLNFTGSGVSASANGTTVDIYIPGGGTPIPGGQNTQIQFNSGSTFSGSSNFTFDYTNNIFYLTGSSLTSGSITLTGSMFVIGAISASFGSNTVGFFGTASWAQSASQSVSSSYSDTSSFSFTSSLAFTASFITASNVWGPFGSSSVASASYASGSTSASYALTASFASNIAAAPLDTYIQYNKDGILGAEEYFRYIYASHSFQHGRNTTAFGNYSHAEGSSSLASGDWSHAEGKGTSASGNYSHAEGQNTKAIGAGSHAEGLLTNAIGSFSHAEGRSTSASGEYSHAEGFGSKADGDYSRAEGSSWAIGIFSHAEGRFTTASGFYSHTEGFSSEAQGSGSHAEGYQTLALGEYSHAEGYFTTALGTGSHAEGYFTSASGNYQLVVGQYNVTSTSQSAFIVGDGIDNSNRHNILFASASWFEVSASNVFLQGLPTSSELNVLVYNTSSGQVYYTASNAIGGGGGNPAPPTNSIQFNDDGVFGGSEIFTFIPASSSVYLTGSLITSGSITASKVLITSSGNNQLVVMGSGSSLTQIYGSQGNLLTVNDSLSGSLFTISDISGYPILDVNSDSTVLLGNYQSPALYTTSKIATVSGLNTIYSIQTSSYDGAFFDYTLISGLNARAGQIMSIWSGSEIRYTETTTTDIGSTSEFIFSVALTAGSASLQVTGSTGAIIKTIIKSI